MGLGTALCFRASRIVRAGRGSIVLAWVLVAVCFSVAERKAHEVPVEMSTEIVQAEEIVPVIAQEAVLSPVEAPLAATSVAAEEEGFFLYIVGGFLVVGLGTALCFRASRIVRAGRGSIVLAWVFVAVCFSVVERNAQEIAFQQPADTILANQDFSSVSETEPVIALIPEAPVSVPVEASPVSMSGREEISLLAIMPKVVAVLVGLLCLGLLYGISQFVRAGRGAIVMAWILVALCFSFAEKRMRDASIQKDSSMVLATQATEKMAPIAQQEKAERVVQEAALAQDKIDDSAVAASTQTLAEELDVVKSAETIIEERLVAQDDQESEGTPLRQSRAEDKETAIAVSKPLSIAKPAIGGEDSQSSSIAKQKLPVVTAIAQEPLAVKSTQALAPVRPVTYPGETSLANYGVSLDILYLQASEDSLRYAEKNVNTLVYGKPVEQQFSYELGFRLGVSAPLENNEWSLGAGWMHFHSTPPVVHASDASGNMFPTLTEGNLFSPGNTQLSDVRGKWSLKMDVMDIVCRRPFPVGDHTIISPIIGVKGAFIRQKVQVDYKFASITYPNLSTPRSMLGLNRCWGVGPEIGVDVKMLLPKEISFVVGGVFSGLCGTFHPTTKYSNLTSQCGDQPGAFWLKDTISRVFVVSQLQGAFARTWQVNKTGTLELILGWECQIWWRQMRLDWYSTVVYPPAGSDLYLQGPFMRAFLTF